VLFGTAGNRLALSAFYLFGFYSLQAFWINVHHYFIVEVNSMRERTGKGPFVQNMLKDFHMILEIACCYAISAGASVQSLSKIYSHPDIFVEPS